VGEYFARETGPSNPTWPISLGRAADPVPASEGGDSRQGGEIDGLSAQGRRFPNYRDLAGFDFASSEVNEALARQLHRCELLELAASSHLSEDMRDALRRSDWLIVVCSPRSKASEWVDAEISYFRELQRDERREPLPLRVAPGCLALTRSGTPRQKPEAKGKSAAGSTAA
jgi:hypothetical protein